MDRPVHLTPNAMIVLKERYLWRDERGYVSETPEELFRRVAKSVAVAEGRGASKMADRFYEMMADLRFLPNTPTLVNAGKPSGQLSACFVLPVEDSLDGIFDSLKQAAKIHQSGGGTGFSFSSLRPKGSIVKTTHGTASGPISFMRIYDTATETIKQGGLARGSSGYFGIRGVQAGLSVHSEFQYLRRRHRRVHDCRTRGQGIFTMQSGDRRGGQRDPRT